MVSMLDFGTGLRNVGSCSATYFETVMPVDVCLIASGLLLVHSLYCLEHQSNPCPCTYETHQRLDSS